MHYRAILDEVKKEGIVIGGHDSGITLIAYLGRDKRFEKAREQGRGYWKLKGSEKASDEMCLNNQASGLKLVIK